FGSPASCCSGALSVSSSPDLPASGLDSGSRNGYSSRHGTSHPDRSIAKALPGPPSYDSEDHAPRALDPKIRLSRTVVVAPSERNTPCAAPSVPPEAFHGVIPPRGALAGAGVAPRRSFRRRLTRRGPIL